LLYVKFCFLFSSHKYFLFELNRVDLFSLPIEWIIERNNILLLRKQLFTTKKQQKGELPKLHSLAWRHRNLRTRGKMSV
jgi:hypothetical protein